MTRTKLRFGRAAVHTFGGLGLYWLFLLTNGVKAAIAAVLAFVIIEGGWRLWRGMPFPPLWLIANGAALVFGTIDLMALTPFMLRYEGAIVNLATAGAFALGAFGSEPLVLRLARHYRSDIPPNRPEIIRFFRAFTIAWSLYFVVRAGVTVWIMSHFLLVCALSVRAAFGWMSLGAMMAISFNGRRVFALCRWFGLFAPAREKDLTVPASRSEP